MLYYLFVLRNSFKSPSKSLRVYPVVLCLVFGLSFLKFLINCFFRSSNMKFPKSQSHYSLNQFRIKYKPRVHFQRFLSFSQWTSHSVFFEVLSRDLFPSDIYFSKLFLLNRSSEEIGWTSEQNCIDVEISGMEFEEISPCEGWDGNLEWFGTEFRNI